MACTPTQQPFSQRCPDEDKTIQSVLLHLATTAAFIEGGSTGGNSSTVANFRFPSSLISLREVLNHPVGQCSVFCTAPELSLTDDDSTI